MGVKRGRPAQGVGRLAAVVGGVDRLTTLSDTRFSVHEETARKALAAGCETAGAPSNRLTMLRLTWFRKG
jgi:hypothetical protein